MRDLLNDLVSESSQKEIAHRITTRVMHVLIARHRDEFRELIRVAIDHSRAQVDKSQDKIAQEFKEQHAHLDFNDPVMAVALAESMKATREDWYAGLALVEKVALNRPDEKFDLDLNKWDEWLAKEELG